MKSSCFSNLIFFEILLIAFARPFHSKVSLRYYHYSLMEIPIKMSFKYNFFSCKRANMLKYVNAKGFGIVSFFEDVIAEWFSL